VDAGCRHEGQHSVKPTSDKDIIREKREQELLLTVLPTVDGSILRKKYLKPLARKGMSDHFLVLMASVKRVPPRETRASGEIADFLVAQVQEPPTFLRKWHPAATSGIFPAKDISRSLVLIAYTALPSAGEKRFQAFPQGLRRAHPGEQSDNP
jgi:hypothetical protein